MRRHANEQEEAQRINEARSELRRKLNEHEGKLKAERPEQPREEKKSSRNAEIGDTVEIKSMGVKAEVVGVNSDGSLELKAGIMNVKAKQSEVYLGKEESKLPNTKQHCEKRRKQRNRPARHGIHRGCKCSGNVYR